ncbi:hypothetical protein ScPMuIL_012014 [Solemya velum]
MTDTAVETIFHTAMPSEYAIPAVTPPQPMMTSQMGSSMIEFSSSNQVRSFQIGYRDCAAEAIRFLIEEENVPVHDPLIIGLVNRLIEQDRALAIHDMMYAQNSPASQGGQVIHNSETNVHNEDSSSMETSTDEVIVSGHHAEPHAEISSDNGQSELNDSGLHEHSTDAFCSTNFYPFSQLSNDTDTTYDADNAKIASLAGEILALLQEENLSDYEDDSDSDEGFHDTDIEDSV